MFTLLVQYSDRVPGYSQFARNYDTAELLLRAERSVLRRGLPTGTGGDLWSHMAEKLDIAGQPFGVRVYRPLLPEPPAPAEGVWHVPKDQFLPPEEFEPPERLERRLAAEDEGARARMVREAERLGIHPDVAEMDPPVWRLLYHISQASELMAVTQHGLTQPEEPGLTPAASARLGSAHALAGLVRDVLEAGLTRGTVSSEHIAAGLQRAAAPYSLLVDLQRRDPER